MNRQDLSCFSADNFSRCCEELGRRDPSLGKILAAHGHPPMWTRPAGFGTLIHIILEQQVSLASAKAAYDKLHERLGEISPRALLALSEEELRACYFSRQKAGYARALAQAMENGELDLAEFSFLPDEEIRFRLKRMKGIGDWTVDIYLMFALQRADIFPVGDLAMVRSFREIKQLPPATPREEITQFAEHWRPYRSIATMILWHHYLQKRRRGG